MFEKFKDDGVCVIVIEFGDEFDIVMFEVIKLGKDSCFEKVVK